MSVPGCETLRELLTLSCVIDSFTGGFQEHVNTGAHEGVLTHAMPNGGVDHLLDAVLPRKLRATRGGNTTLQILDVGANVGQSVERFMSEHWFPAGHKPPKVVCIEPSSAIRQLGMVVDRLNWKFGLAREQRIETVRAAVSANRSVATFMDGLGQNSHLDLQGGDTRHGKGGGGSLQTVPVETVTSLLEARGIAHLDFLKIDTEGFERRVLEGAAAALSDQRIRAIQLEYGLNWFRPGQARDNGRATLQWTVSFLDGHGYDVYYGTPGSLLRLNKWNPVFELPIGLPLNTNIFAFARSWTLHGAVLSAYNRGDSHWPAAPVCSDQHGASDRNKRTSVAAASGADTDEQRRQQSLLTQLSEAAARVGTLNACSDKIGACGRHNDWRLNHAQSPRGDALAQMRSLVQQSRSALASVRRQTHDRSSSTSGTKSGHRSNHGRESTTAFRMAAPRMQRDALTDSSLTELSFDFRQTSSPSICLLSMADRASRVKYAEQIHSHVCFAQHHGYVYYNHALRPPSPGMPVTLSKVTIVEEWMREPNCSWVWWADSDVLFVDMEYSIARHLRSEPAAPDAKVVMTDHHAAINNGGFLIATDWAEWPAFFRAWHEAKNRHAYPFTDNGSMWEVLLQFFAPNYKKYSCPFKTIIDCFHSRARAVWGSPTTSGFRGAGGLRLIAPREGFNNHVCDAPYINCLDPRRGSWASQPPGSWGWWRDDLYFFPQFLPSDYKAKMPAIHHKTSHDTLQMLGAQAASLATRCAAASGALAERRQ